MTLENCIIKFENKISHNYVADCMNEVWESDLNPDLIILMGHDCFAKGLHTGIIATVATLACLTVTISIISKAKKHNRDEES